MVLRVSYLVKSAATRFTLSSSFNHSVVFSLSKAGPSGMGSHNEGEDRTSGGSASPEGTVSDQPCPSGSSYPPSHPQSLSSGGSGTDGGGGFTRNPIASREKLPALPNALKLATVKKKETVKEDTSGGSNNSSRKRKLTALEEIRMMEEQRKEKMNRRDNWLTEGIVVKVVHSKLGERYHRKKGVVEEVRDLFTGIIRMGDSGDKIKIDQAHLETVIPAIGE